MLSFLIFSVFGGKVSKCKTVFSELSVFSSREAVKTPYAPVADRGKLLGSQLCGCEAVGAQRQHVCSADPHCLNKAKSPVDSISSRQIQINSQNMALARAQDMIDKQCSRRHKSLQLGGAGCLNSFKSGRLFLAWS